MTAHQSIQQAWLTGHFWNPANSEGTRHIRYFDLDALDTEYEAAKQAFRSYSEFNADDYADLVRKHHGRAMPTFDGEMGPAMGELLARPRCYVPDYLPPDDLDLSGAPDDWLRVVAAMRGDRLVGRGNWPRCHDVGDFHAVSILVNDRGIGSHLSPIFAKVLANVRLAYAQFGLKIFFVKNGKDMVTGKPFDGRINIEFSFVSASNGWIGLAIVGQNQTCSSNIWCKYLASYRPSNVEREWTTLIKHEIGHNTGRGHTGGGVMNAYIKEGLPTIVPENDPSYGYWRDQFGGVPVPLDDEPPDPPEPPGGHPVFDGALRLRGTEFEYLLVPKASV